MAVSSRLMKRLETLSHVASPFRIEGVNAEAAGAGGADAMALKLADIAEALDAALEDANDPQLAQTLSLGRALIGEMAERFQLAASGSNLFAHGDAA